MVARQLERNLPAFGKSGFLRGFFCSGERGGGGGRRSLPDSKSLRVDPLVIRLRLHSAACIRHSICEGGCAVLFRGRFVGILFRKLAGLEYIVSADNVVFEVVAFKRRGAVFELM